MTYVITLISTAGELDLTPEYIERIRSLLALGGAKTQEPVWLAQGIACDIRFDALPNHSPSSKDVARQIAGIHTPHPIDVAVQPSAGRRKKLLLADMDSTIIEQECLDELADFAGVKDQVAAITARAMAGELAFEPALRERVALLKGLNETILADVFERLSFTPGARELVATMNAHGAVTCLVSGGFTYFTSRVAAALGFQHHRGNTLKAQGGVLTGEVETPILGRAAKLQTLYDLCFKHSVPLSKTLAVGDGANDLNMISQAGLGVAYHAHDILSHAADVAIARSDLTALLYMQGYSEDEIQCNAGLQSDPKRL